MWVEDGEASVAGVHGLHAPTVAICLDVGKGFGVKELNPEIVDVPAEKLLALQDFNAKIAEAQRKMARLAPARPRPWHKEARPDQLAPPGTWNIWLILSGRGWGKSRTGSEWIAEQAARNPNTEWAIVAPTWRDCRKVCIEGRSGLLNALLPGELDSINLSDLTVRLTNGSKIYGYSADGFERLRGSNLAGAWVDEAAVMSEVDLMFAEALMPALRIGKNPRVVITTTPRPIDFLKELIAREDGSVHVTRGRTKDNEANLSERAIAELYARYGDTRAGRQELEGELLEDLEGALWNRTLIDDSRVKDAPSLARIVIGVDPAVTSGEKSDFTGIVVAGRGHDGHLYLLEDATMKGTPNQCMSRVAKLFHSWQADKVIGEVNNGGDFIGAALHAVDPTVAYSTVRATRGKVVRAEPISALWEQGRGHVVGSLPKLEDQMCSYTTDTKKSPDNLDAMVWAATELNVGASAMVFLSAITKLCLECDRPNTRSSVICRGCGAALPRADAA